MGFPRVFATQPTAVPPPNPLSHMNSFLALFACLIPSFPFSGRRPLSEMYWCPGCYTTTQREIDPLDKGRVHSSRKAQSLQGRSEGGLCSQADHLSDSHQLAPLIAFH